MTVHARGHGRKHVSDIYEKIGAACRVEAAAYIPAYGFVEFIPATPRPRVSANGALQSRVYGHAKKGS